MPTLIAYHGSSHLFSHFKPSSSGLHFGTEDQAAHAATIKLARLPLKEFERIQAEHQTASRWLGRLYRVELDMQNTKRIADPRTPAAWSRIIKHARHEGYDSIVYANEYEGSTPSDSYCVFDPKQTKIIEVIQT